MTVTKDYWRNPRATIATKYEHSDMDYAIHGAREAVRCIKLLNISPAEAHKMRLLDFGCGTGRIARVLAAYFGYVVGYDPVEECIQVGLKECSIRIHNLVLTTRLPIKRRYDVIVSVSVISHLSLADQVQMIQDVEGCIKSGGKLLLYYRPYISKNVIKVMLENGWTQVYSPKSIQETVIGIFMRK